MKPLRADLAAAMVYALSEDGKSMEAVHVGVPVIVYQASSEDELSSVVWQGDPVPRTPNGFRVAQWQLQILGSRMTGDWQEVYDATDWRILLEVIG